MISDQIPSAELLNTAAQDVMEGFSFTEEQHLGSTIDQAPALRTLFEAAFQMLKEGKPAQQIIVLTGFRLLKIGYLAGLRSRV